MERNTSDVRYSSRAKKDRNLLPKRRDMGFMARRSKLAWRSGHCGRESTRHNVRIYEATSTSCSGR